MALKFSIRIIGINNSYKGELVTGDHPSRQGHLVADGVVVTHGRFGNTVFNEARL